MKTHTYHLQFAGEGVHEPFHRMAHLKEICHGCSFEKGQLHEYSHSGDQYLCPICGPEWKKRQNNPKLSSYMSTIEGLKSQLDYFLSELEENTR